METANFALLEKPGIQTRPSSPHKLTDSVDPQGSCYGRKTKSVSGGDGVLSSQGTGERSADNPPSTGPGTVKEIPVTATKLDTKSMPAQQPGKTDESSAKHNVLTENGRLQGHQKKYKNKKKKEAGEGSATQRRINRNFKTNNQGVRFLEPRHHDHNVSETVFMYVINTLDLTNYKKGEGFKVVLDIPDDAGSVTCGLYGPDSGDEPVKEDSVKYMLRGNRKNESRMIDKPFRQANKVIVIGRKSKDGNNPHPIDTIFGTFSGKIPPVELNSWMKQDTEEYKVAMEFWKTHALASGKTSVVDTGV